MKKNLTDRYIQTLKPNPGTTRITVFDSRAAGMCVKVTDAGHRSFYVMTRDPEGKQRWAEIRDGNAPVKSLADARRLAPEGVARIKNGQEAYPKIEPEAAPASFKAVAENFLQRHVVKTGLRSGDEVKRIMETYVFPSWGNRPFLDIKRRDVAELLDTIEDNNGPVQADRVLAQVRKLTNWFATRDDDYTSPVIRGMSRTSPKERARKRVLSDGEIRLVWPLLEGTFGKMVKVMLLTGQRRAKVATMKWTDIEDGLWTLPTEAREKNNPGTLRLSRMALDVIESQPTIDKCPYVFAGRTKGPYAGFSPSTRKLDVDILKALQKDDPKAEPWPQWQLHDLRRTAKTLMVRAGVRPDISERTLGHVIGGVEGVYDLHDYDEEKGEALEALAAAVDRILNPPAGNVVELEAVR